MPRHAILITFDHLAASQIGAYGQYRVNTPALDHLASRGTVFHNAYCHAVPPAGQSLADDWATHPQVAEALTALAEAGLAPEVIPQVDFASPRDWVHHGAAAIRSRLASPEPGVTWIQGSGIPDPWVPAHAGWEGEVARLLGTSWSDLLADESEEMTPANAIQELVATGAFSRTCSPEESDKTVDRLSLALYSACVEKLDDRLGRLIREYQRHATHDSLLIVAGLLGDLLPHQFPIRRPVQLLTDLARVPLMIQAGEGHAGGSTILELVQTTDIAHTLAAWLLPAPADRSLMATTPNHTVTGGSLLAMAHRTCPSRSFACVTSSTGEKLIRTTEAQLVTRPSDVPREGIDSIEWLTLKPEDAWDLLNVADQHHDLVETLRALGRATR